LRESLTFVPSNLRIGKKVISRLRHFSGYCLRIEGIPAPEGWSDSAEQSANRTPPGKSTFRTIFQSDPHGLLFLQDKVRKLDKVFSYRNFVTDFDFRCEVIHSHA
jgi:hypothetical protein